MNREEIYFMHKEKSTLVIHVIKVDHEMKTVKEITIIMHIADNHGNIYLIQNMIL